MICTSQTLVIKLLLTNCTCGVWLTSKCLSPRISVFFACVTGDQYTFPSLDWHSSGAVWESRWPSWAVRPNEPSGFRGHKVLLNRALALVTTCPWYVNWHLRTLSITSSLDWENIVDIHLYRCSGNKELEWETVPRVWTSNLPKLSGWNVTILPQQYCADLTIQLSCLFNRCRFLFQWELRSWAHAR